MNILPQHFESHDYAQARRPPEGGEDVLKFPQQDPEGTARTEQLFTLHLRVINHTA